MKKIMVIVGARPQFIKLAALLPALEMFFKVVIVHTGQHYDYALSQGIFEELNIPSPNYSLEVGSNSALRQIAEILVKLDDVLSLERPSCVIVFGDTNSTAAGAIAAAKHHVPLAHVEAGLREFNKSIPEETNKLITDILADYYFCPTETGVQILGSMGITENVFNVGDVMIDLDYKFLSQIKDDTNLLADLGVKRKDYYFATVHRASNTNEVKNLESILRALTQLNRPVVFPVHPRTMSVIKNCGLEFLIDNPNIIAIDPLPYLKTQTLICHAHAVLTDSGGVTKEAYFFKVPGIILDKQTEWVETVREGWNQIAGPETNKILQAVVNVDVPKSHTNVLGSGDASTKIAFHLTTLLPN